jgi:hypothetical protein
LLVAGKPKTRCYQAGFFKGKAEFGQPSTIVTATARP